jgi:hypothetical protein
LSMSDLRESETLNRHKVIDTRGLLLLHPEG